MVKPKQKLSKQEKSGQKSAVPVREKFRMNYIAGIIVSVFAFCIYFNSIAHEYALDDSAAITEHQYVKQGIRGIPKLMTLDFWYSTGRPLGYYRPLSLITYAIEYQFFGLSPHISHLVNVLLFSLIVFVLFLLLSKLFNGYNLLFPLLTALIFAAHPIHTEIVSNIKGRDELLSFLNILLLLYSALSFEETRKKGWMLSGMVAFYFALLSKESAITGIALVPLILYYSGVRNPGRLAMKTLPYLGVIVFFFIQKSILYESVKVIVESDNVNYPYSSNLLRSSSAFMLFLHSFRILLVPYPLTHDYSYNQLPGVPWTNPLALLGLITFAAAVIYSGLQIRKKTVPGFIIGTYLILFTPALGFILLRGGTFAERLLFFPSMAFCMAVAWLLIKVTRVNIRKKLFREGTSDKGFIMVACLALLAVLPMAAMTVHRNNAWVDSLTLFAVDREAGPNCALLQYHWGCERINEGVYTKDPVKKNRCILEGLNGIRKAVEIFPHFYAAYNRMGEVYEYLGSSTNDRVKSDSAIFAFLEASRLERDQDASFIHLGRIYSRLQQYGLASYYYHQALLINPSSEEAKTKIKQIRDVSGLDVAPVANQNNSGNSAPPSGF